MDQAQRSAKFGAIESAWGQFSEVCHEEVEPSHMRNVRRQYKDKGTPNCAATTWSPFLAKYMSSNAPWRQRKSSRSLLAQPSYSDTFDTDKTFYTKLLCARKDSGIGRQLLRVCENLAKCFLCASAHLQAVPSA